MYAGTLMIFYLLRKKMKMTQIIKGLDIPASADDLIIIVSIHKDFTKIIKL